MSGRHAGGRHTRARRGAGTRSRLLLVGALAVLLAAAVAVAVIRPFGRSASESAPTASPAGCISGISLTVTADPSVAGVVDDVAQHWAAGRPVVDGACPTVVVRSAASADTAALLAKPDVTPPDLWIPDSSLWVQHLQHDTAGADSPVSSMWLQPAIATSPLVLATTPGHAAGLRTLASGGWSAVFAGASPVALPDPTRTTAGLAALLTARSLLGGDSDAPSRSLVNALVTLAHTRVADPAAGLRALTQRPATAPAVVVSEQDALAATGGSGSSATMSTVYPSGRSVGLDWPVAQFAPPGGDPARRDAAVALVAQLSGPYARQHLDAAGLRDPTGQRPTTADAAPTTVPLATPTVAQESEGLRAWAAAGRGTRTLVVVDLSGSMSDPAGGGQSKIELAAAAERVAVDFFPDSSSLGLWGFSVDRAPGADWTELVALGPLSGSVGGTNRRAALIGAASRLPAITGGDTGLYSTALAAYETVRTGYDPASLNSVVLITDGANTDTRGVDLPGLLARLRGEHDPSRPLPLITVAIGQDADVATLRTISTTTGGRTYLARQAGDIRDALLDAIIQTG